MNTISTAELESEVVELLPARAALLMIGSPTSIVANNIAIATSTGVGNVTGAFAGQFVGFAQFA
jgi:hypothetical protein